VTPLFALLFDTLDERLRLRRPGRKVLNKVFPHHWAFLLGEVALFSFVVLVLTGVFLTMFYQPSVDRVVYTGSMGQDLPAAFESIVRISHDVPGGLLFRRLHRGAAYLFIAGLFLHAARILLTGAFRRPREVNYHVGVVLLMLDETIMCETPPSIVAMAALGSRFGCQLPAIAPSGLCME
jgi:ubiquinol-cytochrome c reductase cytochrome b subunit